MNETLEEIRSQKNYYRDNYRRMMFVIVLMLVVNLMLIGVIFFNFGKDRVLIIMQPVQMVN